MNLINYDNDNTCFETKKNVKFQHVTPFPNLLEITDLGNSMAGLTGNTCFGAKIRI